MNCYWSPNPGILFFLSSAIFFYLFFFFADDCCGLLKANSSFFFREGPHPKTSSCYLCLSHLQLLGFTLMFWFLYPVTNSNIRFALLAFQKGSSGILTICIFHCIVCLQKFSYSSHGSIGFSQYNSRSSIIWLQNPNLVKLQIYSWKKSLLFLWHLLLYPKK